MKLNPIRWGAWLLLGVLQMFALMITFGAWAVSRLWHHRAFIMPRIIYSTVVVVLFMVGAVVAFDMWYDPHLRQPVLDLTFFFVSEGVIIGTMFWMDARRARIFNEVEWTFFARQHDGRYTPKRELAEAD